MRIHYKESSTKIGCIVGGLTLIIIFYTFPILFGNTPVNLMKLGSGSGNKNYMINLLSFVFINLMLLGIITFFAKEKVKWILGVVFGTGITALLITVFIFSYFEIFWRGKT